MGGGCYWRRVENVLWGINDTVLPKSVRSVVVHCGSNNIGTSSSDEISLCVVPFAKSISHRYPNNEDIVNGLLPRDIHWSKWKVKIKNTIVYLRNYCKKSTKITFKNQAGLSDNSLNMQLYYKDRFHLTENGNINFSKLIIETLQDV